MATSRVHSERGISVLGILVAVMILAAMGSMMAVLVATNQESRIKQLHSDQSFASAQAGLEVTLGLIHNGVNPCDPLSRNLEGDTLLGNSIVVNRANSRIYVAAAKGDASTSVSIVDPIPPSNGQLLQVDTTHAKDASNGAPPRKLIGITFQLAPGCGQAVTITTMTISWLPDTGEKVLQIKFDGANVYDGVGMPSGDTENITDQTIADANVHQVDFIRWDADIQNRLYTIQFNFIDGSNKIITVDTR